MATQDHVNNYVLGKGEVYFGRFGAGTTERDGERYIGNTPEFNVTIESEKLDHFSADRGIREKDKSVVLEVSRSGTMTCDNIDHENLALFFFGDASILTVVGATYTDEPVTEEAVAGMHYQLGESINNPSGRRGIVYPGSGGTLFSLKIAGGATLVHGTDYILDKDLGRVEILAGGDAVGEELTATYTTTSHNRKVTISGSTAVEGSLRLISYNPAGEQTDVYMPYVSISPNGDFALKSEEWQQLPFNVEVLKKGNLEAFYLDGRPYTP